MSVLFDKNSILSADILKYSDYLEVQKLVTGGTVEMHWIKQIYSVQKHWKLHRFISTAQLRIAVEKCNHLTPSFNCLYQHNMLSLHKSKNNSMKQCSMSNSLH